MASNFIEIDLSSRIGPLARRNVEQLRDAINDLQTLKDQLDQVGADNDWTSIQEKFGVPATPLVGAPQTNGQTYYNLVTSALAAIDVAAVNSYIDRVG